MRLFGLRCFQYRHRAYPNGGRRSLDQVNAVAPSGTGGCGVARVKGKVAIVTGAAGGIGRAVCQLLAQEGAKIALTDLRDENGEKVVQQIKDCGGIAEYWHLDVS